LLGISGNGKRSTTRLLDAEFPKFRQLLPVGPPPKRDGGPTGRCCGLPECVDLVGSLDHLAILPGRKLAVGRTMATADH
jgi:hypothetical protein